MYELEIRRDRHRPAMTDADVHQALVGLPRLAAELSAGADGWRVVASGGTLRLIAGDPLAGADERRAALAVGLPEDGDEDEIAADLTALFELAEGLEAELVDLQLGRVMGRSDQPQLLESWRRTRDWVQLGEVSGPRPAGGSQLGSLGRVKAWIVLIGILVGAYLLLRLFVFDPTLRALEGAPGALSSPLEPLPPPDQPVKRGTPLRPSPP